MVKKKQAAGLHVIVFTVALSLGNFNKIFAQTIGGAQFKEYNIVIKGNVSDWQTTQIHAKKNDLVIIDASGTIKLGPAAGFAKPEGVRSSILELLYNKVPKIRHGALLCNNGSDFVAIKNATVIASEISAGNLPFRVDFFEPDFLGEIFISNSDQYLKFTINDKDFSNNTGLFEAKVTVIPTDKLPVNLSFKHYPPCNNNQVATNYDIHDVWMIGTGYHNYEVKTNICAISVRGCTIENVFNLMISNASFLAPTSSTQPIADCNVMQVKIPVMGMGSILTQVDYLQHWIINNTLPDHPLHPGKVKRYVVEENGYVKVWSVGEGNGIFPEINVLKSNSLWTEVDSRLSVAFKDKYSTQR